MLKSLNFKHVSDFVEFLIKCEKYDDKLLEQHTELNETRLSKDRAKIVAFRERIVDEYARIDEKPTGSIGREMPAGEKIRIKLQVMEHVN